MKKWIKPVFEEFDVNGEVTAYAGAEPGDGLARGVGAGGGRVGRREAVASEPAAGGDPTGIPSRHATR